MTRPKKESVVQRFVCFGTSVKTPELRSNHSGAGLQRPPSIKSFDDFPPLGAPRAPLFCKEMPNLRADNGSFKGFIARPPPRPPSDSGSLDSNHASRPSPARSSTQVATTTPAHKAGFNDVQASFLAARLAEAQQLCQQLQNQLTTVCSISRSDQQPAAQPTQLASTSCSQQQAVVPVAAQQPTNDAAQPAISTGSGSSHTQGQQGGATTSPPSQQQGVQGGGTVAVQDPGPQKLTTVQQAVKQLLLVFQQHGYEVAAGLDNLQDDLFELEQLSEAQQQQWKIPAPVVVGEGGLGSESASLPEAAAAEGLLADKKPSSEGLVMLRARREHVESEFLELVRVTVAGLEGLLELCHS